LAKLPAPTDEAKVKAAEAAAKTAWAGKVDNYKLCLSQDKVAARVKSADKNAKPMPKPKDAKAPVAATGCVDPGPFVYPPVVANTPAAPVAIASAAAKTVVQPKKP
jgi:hypothetical protein